MSRSLLIVEDNRALALAVGALAERCGLKVQSVPTLARARDLLRETSFSVMLLDIGLPDGNGLEFLETCSFEKPASIAVVSAHGEIENAIAARKLGVEQFFDKPIDFEALESFLRDHSSARATSVEKSEDSPSAVAPFIGASKAMRPVFQQIAQACAGSQHVVVRGAVGTGKSHVARLIQNHAGSTAKDLTDLHATAATEKGELEGVLDRSSGGTLIVENIVALSLEIQSVLVAELDRLGDDAPRLIVTVEEGGLRPLVLSEVFLPDLYYRLQVLEVSLPPLRERTEDIAALLAYFLGEKDPEGRRSVSEEIITSLKNHHWPGNLRELRNVANYLLVAGAGRERLAIEDLPPSFAEKTASEGQGRDEFTVALEGWVSQALDDSEGDVTYRSLHDQLEGRLLTILLEKYDGKPSHLAQALSMNRVTLRKKLKNIER